jgi:hypothetical protein
VRALRCVVEQRIIPGGHGSLHARFQGAQLTELADDPGADVLDHVCNVGIAGRLDVDTARFETLVCALEKHALNDDQMVM